MKQNRNKSSVNIKAGHDDEIIGTALSRELPFTRPGIIEGHECPTPEDIAAILEGQVSPRKKDLILKHLSTCDDCYELFLLTAGLYENQKKEVLLDKLIKKEKMPKIFYWRPIALAASILIMVLSVYLFYRNGNHLSQAPTTLIKKHEPAKEYPAPPPPPGALNESSAKSFQAKTKITADEKAGPPNSQSLQATTQPEEVKDFDAASAAGASPVPMSRVSNVSSELREKDEADKAETDKEETDKKVETGEKDNYVRQQTLKLKRRICGIGNYIPGEILAEILNDTITLTHQISSELAIDLYLNELKPLLTMKIEDDKTFIMPNADWFYNKSEPGTVEYDFFSLARSGWCVGRDLCHIPETNHAALKKLQEQWQNLVPRLTGIFKQVAIYTIDRLDS
ncbi:MAG: hypothetical protein MUF15_11685 [Acidobacteria bacterium]|jgi:hypothetical protein|nr:hypothetical protein [Acidobacteriota bacterium]